MFHLFLTHAPAQYLRDMPLAARPDVAVQYRQAKVTATAITDYVKQQGGTGGVATQSRDTAIRDLENLRDKLSIATAPEVADVQLILATVRAGEPLTAENVSTIKRVVDSLERKLGMQAAHVAGEIASKLEAGDRAGVLTSLHQISEPEELQKVLKVLNNRGLSYLDLFKKMDGDGETQSHFVSLTAPGMDAGQKADAIKQFAGGVTPKAQEQAILRLLSAAGDNPGELPKVLDELKARHISYLDLFKEMSGDRAKTLLELTAPLMQPDQKAAAIKLFADGPTPGAQREAIATLIREETRDANKIERLMKAIQDTGISKAQLFGKIFDRCSSNLEDQIQTLQDQGKLTKELMVQLVRLCDPKTELDPRFNREDLFENIITDLADPDSITQGKTNTCGPTVVQRALALHSPARYVEMLTGLASKNGDGAKDLVPAPAGLVRPADLGPQKERSNTAHLFGASLMDLAARKDGEAWSPDDDSGLNSRKLSGLVQDVLGFKVDTAKNEEAWPKLEAAFKREPNQAVPVHMDWGPGIGHDLLYLGPDPSGKNVLLMNPKGERTRMSLAEFQKRLDAATIPIEGAHIPPPRHVDLGQYVSWKQH